MATSFEIVGIDRLKAALLHAGTLANDALEVAMVEEMESVMTEAKKQTPVDTGTLRASGVVLPPERSGTKIEVDAGFGGAASDYAVYVHEDLSKHHPTGNAKFLEQPFLSRKERIIANLAVRVRKAVERAR